MKVYHASPEGGKKLFKGEEVDTSRLQTAINMAMPGDTIQVLPGRYYEPIVINFSGNKNNPIRLVGATNNQSVIFDGAKSRTASKWDFGPKDSDFSFVKIQSADWIIIEGINFENCWPGSIFIRGSKNIKIKDCTIIGSQFAIYARNKSSRIKTKNILIDHVNWIQDPDHDMWDGRITWMDIKQEYRTELIANYFNGALFGSYNIYGNVIVRNCDVSHAFNCIRMDSNGKVKSNSNIFIYNNHFSYIRDNAIEPERKVENWWVYNNTFHNIHAPFSFDTVNGKYLYFINNTILNHDIPSNPDVDEYTGGKIFKFSKTGNAPEKAFYFLFNSILTRTTYAKGSPRNLTHVNNAISICRIGKNCKPERQMLTKIKWDKSNDFDNDLCDIYEYPDNVEFEGNNIPVKGINTFPQTFSKPRITPKWNKKLVLQKNSPGKKKSKSLLVILPTGKSHEIKSGLDIGSQNNESLSILDFARKHEKQ